MFTQSTTILGVSMQLKAAHLHNSRNLRNKQTNAIIVILEWSVSTSQDVLVISFLIHLCRTRQTSPACLVSTHLWTLPMPLLNPPSPRSPRRKRRVSSQRRRWNQNFLIKESESFFQCQSQPSVGIVLNPNIVAGPSDFQMPTGSNLAINKVELNMKTHIELIMTSTR